VDLDALLQGLVPGTHIVAARSGRGKSVLAAQIAAHAASTAEGSVAVFSLEMAANSMLKRWLSWIAKVNVNRLHAASTNDLRDRWARLVKAAGDLLQKRLELNTTATDVPQIWRKCLGLKAKKGLSLVVVDYVQLIDVGRQMEKRYLEIREISRSLAMMAKHLGVPVLAVAQLNRESTRRKDNRPSEEDIADGDSLLRDATTCLLIHRDLVAQKGQDQRDLEGLAELILSKNRHGRTGTVRVKWDRLLACFEDSERGAV
jgi:replicative DNA helicase